MSYGPPDPLGTEPTNTGEARYDDHIAKSGPQGAQIRRPEIDPEMLNTATLRNFASTADRDAVTWATHNALCTVFSGTTGTPLSLQIYVKSSKTASGVTTNKAAWVQLATVTPA